MTDKESPEIKNHQVLSHDEWLAARITLLAREKEFTRQREELAQLRRALPWEEVEKQYVFDGPGGKEALSDLFGKHSQLVVYHFMFGPDDDEGCLHCSFWADSFNGASLHLPHRDVSFVAISRAPLEKIEPFKQSGAVFHTSSCFARGIDMMNATYQYLDLVPRGRDEQDLPDPQDWVRHHDRYEN